MCALCAAQALLFDWWCVLLFCGCVSVTRTRATGAPAPLRAGPPQTPQTRPCGQTGGAMLPTSATTTHRRHQRTTTGRTRQEPWTSSTSHQEGEHATPDRNGNRPRYRHPARGNPRHHAPTAHDHPGPHREPDPTGSNVGPRASSPDPSKGLADAPSTPQLTGPAGGARHMRTTQRPPDTGPDPGPGPGTRRRPRHHRAGGRTAPRTPNDGGTPAGTDAGPNPGSDTPPGTHSTVRCCNG